MIQMIRRQQRVQIKLSNFIILSLGLIIKFEFYFKLINPTELIQTQMQLDKRKQLILRAIPQRKKTSKKLKQKVLEQIYFRSSSLPQKKYAQPKQKDSTFTRRHQDLRNQSSQPSNKQRFQSQLKSSFEKIDQQQQFVPHRPVQRKNRSLPKYLYSQPSSSHNDSQFQLQSFKNTDQYRTKAKKLSQKEQKEILHQSQQKHRLQTLQQILKKKNSQRLIRENLLSSNVRNSPMQSSQPQKPKHKQSKMIGYKYAFENRKFTNLSKYKSSVGARQNPFGSSKLQYDRQSNNNPSRKVSKQNSKTRIKTSEHDNVCEEDDRNDQNTEIRNNEAEIKDLDLREYIDGENVINKDTKDNKVATLQDMFGEAYELYLGVVSAKDRLNEEMKESKPNSDKNLERCFKLLKSIQKQTGSLSRKTVLLLGLVSYHSQQYNNCIFYLQNVFRQVNYNLSLIDSIKNWINGQDVAKFFSDFFIVLAQSYKKTQNFLCSIKVLDHWEKHIVQKCLGNYHYKHTIQTEQNKKRTISHLNNYQTYKNERKFTRNDNFKKQNESVTSENELNPKKKSYSFLRQNSQGKMATGYFSTTVKQKQRTQSLIKKQSVKYQTQQLNLKPKSKHLSIKTLSDINLNLNQQTNQQIIDQEQLRNLPQKEGQIFAVGYLMRARIQFEIKNFYASIKDYEKTLACSQNKLQPGLELATLYYKIGRKEKCIQFLEGFLQQVSSQRNFKPKKQESVKQIKYHLAVMLYKSGRFNDSMKVLESIQKDDNQGLQGQISFYKALNTIKLKRVFIMSKQVKKPEANRNNPDQQTSKNVDEVLIMLQQSIDMGCSQFYIYAAYFLRIYLLLFKVRHYYGAQYEIDRMKETIERKKYGFSIGQISERQKIQYGKISIQPFSGIISLQDLIKLTSGIICILKLKLDKGLKLISQIQEKVKISKRLLQSANIISIQTINPNDSSQQQHTLLISQMLKLMYQFKYYALFTMRQYQSAIRCLQKIRLIDGMAKQTSVGKAQQLRINQHRPLDNQDNQTVAVYEIFTSESDKLNYLNLQALILIEQKKFHEALKMLKLAQHQSQPQDNKRHKRTQSGNLQTISTVIEYKKDENMFHIIKALCYILLYQYLQDQKPSTNSNSSDHPSNTNLHNRTKSMDSIKVNQTINHNQRTYQQQSQESSVQQNNEQILLVAEDLLSQCLVCDKQNYEILYLIAVIHYELQRYESALNYIRQAIELSDDHMIKHYYLKANMKLLLGKYQQAVKDYSNAITVHKEFEKERKQHQQQLLKDSTDAPINQTSNLSSQSINENPSPFSKNRHTHQTLINQTPLLTTRTTNTQLNLNQYYEESQQMHFQIYLNRAIAYLKYAYSLQFQTCRAIKYRTQDQNIVKYSEVRENIANLKSTAAQDIVLFFNTTISKLRAQYSAIVENTKKTITPQSHHKSHSNTKSNLNHTQPSKPTDITPQQTIKLQPFVQKTMKIAPFIQLLLHTSDVQPMLQISRTFMKQFNFQLISDQQLLVYFYIAKQLNNCLLLMEKIIKKYYLSQKNKRDSKNPITHNSKPNQLRKQNTSKYQAQQQYQPYFKSKKDHKASKACNYPQFNAQKYTPKNTQYQNHRHDQSGISSPQKNHEEHEKIQKLIFDKKILSALKDSSSNSKEDYENALVTLLEEQQTIRKNALGPSDTLEGGSIFTYADFVFFIGVLYYLLEDFQNAIRHFVSSYTLKKNQNKLYSLKSIASPSPVSFQDSSSQQGKWYNQKLQMNNLKNYEQIYDNRVYSKEEIQYNIGVAYLMAEDYNSAYDYLERHQQFVEIIELVLTQNEANLDDKKTKNKLKKIKTNFEQSQPEEDQDISFDQVSVKTKTNKSDLDSDITPFPTHNRLCSIYPQKSINGKSFFLSFCLPKIQLPLLGLLSQNEIQIASLYRSQKQDKNEAFIINDTKELFINRSHSKNQNSTKSLIHKTENFLVPKNSIINFLDIVSLKDIEMKPIAPWIQKDKEKRCIRFTDNFLAESYDLKTQTTTERKHRNSSKKDMFAQSSSKAFHKKPTQRHQGTSERKEYPQNIQKERERVNAAKLIKKSKADEYNFLKQKQKQKTGQNRYNTIEHD